MIKPAVLYNHQRTYLYILNLSTAGILTTTILMYSINALVSTVNVLISCQN